MDVDPVVTEAEAIVSQEQNLNAMTPIESAEQAVAEGGLPETPAKVARTDVEMKSPGTPMTSPGGTYRPRIDRQETDGVIHCRFYPQCNYNQRLNREDPNVWRKQTQALRSHESRCTKKRKKEEGGEADARFMAVAQTARDEYEKDAAVLLTLPESANLDLWLASQAIWSTFKVSGMSLWRDKNLPVGEDRKLAMTAKLGETKKAIVVLTRGSLESLAEDEFYKWELDYVLSQPEIMLIPIVFGVESLDQLFEGVKASDIAQRFRDRLSSTNIQYVGVRSNFETIVDTLSKQLQAIAVPH
eukprot:TRINITY_DN9243_c0_g1_i1.p1 TRINITY_DN9243_c0_g1~~TRINITY_DN9243_c0_g1_i1.p1  ORF type:complete len:340 (+),score=78.59 TRINITY_DN9243_c0_g1_i1:121-1020(+)